MRSVEGIRKRADPPVRLRVSTQRELAAPSAGEGAVRRAVTDSIRRIRRAILPLACALFVAASASAAIAIPLDAAYNGSGVQLDPNGIVVSVAPGSLAWNDGIRAGWRLLTLGKGVTAYGFGNSVRPVPDGPDPSVPPPITAVVPSLVAIALALLLTAGRQRRTGNTLAVVAAVVGAPVWAVRLGVAGDALATLPVGLAVALAWQVSGSLDARPRLARHMSVPMAAVVALVLGSIAAFAAATWFRGPAAGVAAASIVYVAATWLVVVRWQVAVASAGPEARSRLALARAVAFNMLPFSDRVRRRGAQAERDRLASDLHAEVLPAIASTAAALERRGATEEAERLRRLAASVRDLVSDRRLPLLDDGGLVAAAEWLAESIQARAPLTIEIDLGGDTGTRQPGRVERAAYRVLQLALDNVIRHAEADNAFVAIAGDARSLELTVADNGRGIDTDTAARAMNAGRLGLADMRAEAESVGAKLEVGPRVPCGTLVKMRWPG
jgi:signal transduction histidine kinase